MDVFISWSGERSRAAAEALRGWLPKIINALKPWLSSADIDKGVRWGTDVASRLEVANAGIICLTPSNLHSDWILFEAGALSKTLQNTFVCPFLIGIEPSDLKPPLAQFQSTRATKADVLRLLRTLNKALGENALEDDHIKEAFEVWWPNLEVRLKGLPPDESVARPHRPDRELIEEILALVRNQNYFVTEAPGKPDPLEDFTVRNEIHRVLTSLDSSFIFRALDHPDHHLFQIQKAGRSYELEVPVGIPLEDVEQCVMTQLAELGVVTQ